MPWISVDSKLPSHRKLRILRKRLCINLHEAIGVLVTIWLWALEDADRQGLIINANARDVAEAIRWKGDADLLIAALTEAMLIHIDDKGILIHDWQDHQGPWEAYLKKQKFQKEYMKKKRAREQAGLLADSNNSSNDSCDIDSTNNEPIPNHTLPNAIHRDIYPIPRRIEEAIFAWLGGVPPVVAEDLAYFMVERGCDEDLVLEAMAETRRRGIRVWEYARAVLKSATDDGVLRGQDYKGKKKARKAVKEDANGKRNEQGPYVEGGYDWNKLADS